MKVHIKKAVSLLLAVVLCVSAVVVPAAAVSPGPYYIDLPALNVYCVGLNLNVLTGLGWRVLEDKQNHCWRIQDTNNGAWYVDIDGRYPCAKASGDVPTTGPGTAPSEIPATPSISNNKFVDARLVKWSPRVISTYDALGKLVVNLGIEGINATLKKNTVSSGEGNSKSMQVWYVADASGNAVYCNSKGVPYTAPVTPSAADNDFDYIINDNSTENNIVVDTNIIDNSNNQMTIIDENGEKITLNIDSLYWDDSTHSYTANTYNIVNNTYNYYTYNITYNISNTYINYIGSNAAYEQDEYKYYYELPDGRSSEDLTAEEVAGMSFQFADVVNYARSATDTSLRTLYHFDGNTEDSGYFSTQTKFKWLNNASITYMDSAGFGGALYLDETNHNFDMDLPSNFPSSTDFSIQWRHYQASQPDTQSNINNSLAIGGVTLFRWDERSFYWNGSATACTTVPVGNWHELALIRNNGILYFYVNGLKVASKADTTGYQGKLMFSFGATSRAYTMLDELRVVNFAVAEDGVSYQCATVPYDTNLVLVLPDGEFPVADEYWRFENNTAILKSNFTQGSKPMGWTEGYLEPANKLPHYNDGYTTLFRSSGFSSFGSYGIYIELTSFFPLNASEKIYYFTLIDVSGVAYTQSIRIGRSGNRFYFNGSRDLSFSWGHAYFETGGSNDDYLYLSIFANAPLDFIYAELAATPITDFEYVSCIYSSADIKPNTAAVQSSIPVNGYTVGGVRPTFPVRGDVWFPVEGRRIGGCYIYDGSMWRTAGCRYYTGTRWIPIYAFDIYTLADCWDIADADGIDPTPPITSESGFWNWWKGQWTDFRKWMEQNQGGGSGGGGDGPGSIILPDGTLPNLPGSGEGGEGGEDDDGFSIFDIVKGAVDGLWKLVSGLFGSIFGGVLDFFLTLPGQIDGFFSAFDGDMGVFGFAKYGGADIWD